MSGKILLLTLIAVGSAQVPQNSRLNRERVIRINSEYDTVPQSGGGVRTNRGPTRRAGVQNVIDGRLRTNLDSGQNNFPPRDGAYVVEGAAFTRQDENERFDVHSSQGRRVFDSSYPIDGASLNDGRLNQNYNTGESAQNLFVNDHRNQNRNNYHAAQVLHVNSANEQSYAGNTDRYLNSEQTYDQRIRDSSDRTTFDHSSRQADQNTFNKNRFSSQSTESSQPNIDHNVRTNIDRTPSRQRDKNTRYEENIDDENKFYAYQNSNERNLQNDKTTNYQINSRTNHGQHEGLSNNQNKFHNTQDTTIRDGNGNNKPTNRNSGASATKYQPTVSNFDTKTRIIVDKVVANSRNYDQEAIDKEINNQITKMYFEESTEPKPKPTQDNELSSRDSGIDDKKWVWGETTPADKNNTSTEAVPGVDDRAAFVGDQCPTGKVKFNNVCVDKD